MMGKLARFAPNTERKKGAWHIVEGDRSLKVGSKAHAIALANDFYRVYHEQPLEKRPTMAYLSRLHFMVYGQRAKFEMLGEAGYLVKMSEMSAPYPYYMDMMRTYRRLVIKLYQKFYQLDSPIVRLVPEKGE